MRATYIPGHYATLAGSIELDVRCAIYYYATLANSIELDGYYRCAIY
jgi:hypothetical protein